jgi:hypothetical protein
VELTDAERKDLAGTYARWAAGLCPCCGSRYDWWEDAVPIAEGVLLCGYCVDLPGRDHRDGAPGILQALVERL